MQLSQMGMVHKFFSRATPFIFLPIYVYCLSQRLQEGFITRAEPLGDLVFESLT